MVKVTLGLNALDPATWVEQEVEDLFAFLLNTFGPRFPVTGKIFHEVIDVAHDVTPDPERLETAEHVLTLQGHLYVIVYPAGPEQFIYGGILIGGLIVSWLLAPDKKPPPPTLHPVTGSPNNKLADRQNTGRPNGRIPDIFGMVRSTPDLLQLPYTTYVNDRETEIAYMCVGKGEYQITDIRDGDMFSSQIEGMDVIVYGPGEIPGGGTPDLIVGTMIEDPVYTVRKVEAVNGQPMLAQNAKTFVGDIPAPESNLWLHTQFRNVSSGVGQIHVGGTSEEILGKVRVGDKLDILAPTTRVSVGIGLDPLSSGLPNALSKNGHRLGSTAMSIAQGGTGAIPDLTGTGLDAVTVTAIDTSTFWNLTVSIPGSMQAQWDLIDTYTFGLFEAGAIGNGGSLITPQDAEWVGPFFLESPVSVPNEQVIVCNFVSQEGLYADDGKSVKPFAVRMQVEITPADSLGFPSGAPLQYEDTVVLGSISSRNTRATTLRIVPVTPGNFLIRARRLTRTVWKQDSPSQYPVLISDQSKNHIDTGSALALTGDRIANNPGGSNPNEVKSSFGIYFTNSSYLPFYGNSQDEVRWTHCYSLTTQPAISFGNITSIHTRTVASEGATSNKVRKLNCLAYRRISTWDGATFGGPLVENNLAENVLFSVLKDSKIGNLDNSLIDFPGIAGAFAEVRAAFGGPTSDGFGGDEAGQFNFTFDDEKVSLEETISIICSACFCVPYRQGDILKVRPDLSTPTARLLINHRNRVPGSEQRNVTFGTEADYDGVRVEYTDVDINDPTNDAVKTYTVPPLDIATRPKVIQVPGIRLKKHAAWHAWRAYNTILYANTTTELEACAEAMEVLLHERILVSDGTRVTVQDGEVLAVSGSTLTVSQNVDAAAGTGHTIFLQHTDGTVESIAIASRTDARTIVLASAPGVSLVTNPDVGVPTMYFIVKNDFTQPTAFRVTEKSPTDKNTYNIVATNYAHAFYWNDGLYVWLPFISQSGLIAARDWGPYEMSTSSINGASSVVDGVRGLVYSGTALDQHIQITTLNVFAPESYTKSCWVLWNGVSHSCIVGSPETNDEAFNLDHTANELQGIHAGVAYCSFFGFPTNVWTMASLTYDAVADVMIMYVNGEIVDSATSVPGRPLSNMRLFGQFSGVNGFFGRADDLRIYQRVMAPEEIRELYQRTRIP